MLAIAFMVWQQAVDIRGISEVSPHLKIFMMKLEKKKKKKKS